MAHFTIQSHFKTKPVLFLVPLHGSGSNFTSAILLRIYYFQLPPYVIRKKAAFFDDLQRAIETYSGVQITTLSSANTQIISTISSILDT